MCLGQTILEWKGTPNTSDPASCPNSVWYSHCAHETVRFTATKWLTQSHILCKKFELGQEQNLLGPSALCSVEPHPFWTSFSMTLLALVQWSTFSWGTFLLSSRSCRGSCLVLKIVQHHIPHNISYVCLLLVGANRNSEGGCPFSFPSCSATLDSLASCKLQILEGNHLVFFFKALYLVKEQNIQCARRFDGEGP